MPTTVGHFLLNDVLPDTHKVTGAVTNRQLHDHLVGLARSNPDLYVHTVTRLKRRGDEIATLEGISVGLDDITPDYAARDAVLGPLADKVVAETDPKKRTQLVIEAQQKIIELTKRHPGSMTQMALSGARGNIPQLMKIVASPLAANDDKHGVNPFVIRRSYAEGLSPAEYWTTTPEARANNVASVVSVSQPGEMAKLLVANMVNKVVSSPDCGTHNGVLMKVTDVHALDRFLAREEHGLPRNTLITPQVVQKFRAANDPDFLVRSPMTCAAPHGVCQKCQGLNEKGQIHQIGTNVGVRAAHAMAEPLTQMALSSKHSVLTIKEKKPELQGLKGVRQLLEIPKAFRHEAVLAPHAGTVQKIEKAPQGGTYIYLTGDKQPLYAASELTVTATIGQHVEAGDALTNGVPHPAKVVGLKGLGAGRQYFVNALHKIYQDTGLNLDKRHLELLAKSELNHVRLLDHDESHPEFLKGDVLNYNAFREAYAKDTETVPLEQAVGRRLGQELFHHTLGTPVTRALVKEFAARGVREVRVAKNLPRVEFVMKPVAMNPLLDKDWLGRMAHRYLKDSVHDAVHFGEESDLHGLHPIPAYAYGAELRHGPGGTY